MKIPKLIVALLTVLSAAGTYSAFTSSVHVNAASYAPGCYVSGSGGSGDYTTTSCPNKSPEDAIRYPGGKCWYTRITSSGQAPFAEFYCSSGQPISTAPTAPALPGACGGDGEPLCTGDEDGDGKYQCGKSIKEDGTTDKDRVVLTGFNFGCRGNNASVSQLNPIIDIMFAIFRFLSAGVGLVAVGSIIIAGMQYSASRGDPQATNASIKRITNTLIGLLIYLFMFALINFLIPGGLYN